MKSLTTTFILLFSCFLLSAQEDLIHLIESSTIIVEGEIIEQTAFKFEKNNLVYTKNKIRVNKIFKGSLAADYFYINTLGGEYEGRVHNWSHNFSFGEEGCGMFFLSPAIHPVNTRHKNNYELTIGKSGYFPYIQYSTGINPGVYSTDSQIIEHVPDELYDVIKQSTQLPVQSVSSNKFERKLLLKNVEGATNCAEYIVQNFEVVELNTFAGSVSYQIEFDINVRALEDAFELEKAEILMEYSTALLGTSLALNNNITVTLSSTVTDSYQLTTFDATPSKVGVKFERSVGSTPVLISNTTTQLYHAVIQIQNYSPTEILQLTVDENFDISTFEISDGVISTLLCNIYSEDISGVVSDFFVPSISSISPTSLPAGTRYSYSLLTIIGDDFGTERGTSEVQFTVLDGVGSQWAAPLDGDYIDWNDDKIEVLVPSYAKIPGTTDGSVNFQNVQMPGTGEIRIKKIVMGVEQYSVGNPTLEITYSVANDKRYYSTGYKGQPQIMTRQNFNGSYTVLFSYEFKYDDNGIERTVNDTGETYTEIARQAIEAWQCTTGLNFVIDETLEWNEEWGCEGNPNGDPNLQNIVGLHLDFDLDPISADLMNGRPRSYENTSCVVSEIDIEPDFLRCAEVRVVKEEFDDIDNTDNTPISTENTKQRFYNALLHELGHTHYLNHVNSSSELMRPTIIVAPAQITQYANEASRYVQDKSLTHSCQNDAYVLNECYDPNSIENIAENPDDYFNVYSTYDKVVIENFYFKQVEQVRIFDVSGRLIRQQFLNHNDNLISIPRIRDRGIFIISISDDQNQLYTFKISQL